MVFAVTIKYDGAHLSGGADRPFQPSAGVRRPVNASLDALRKAVQERSKP